PSGHEFDVPPRRFSGIGIDRRREHDASHEPRSVSRRVAFRTWRSPTCSRLRATPNWSTRDSGSNRPRSATGSAPSSSPETCTRSRRAGSSGRTTSNHANEEWLVVLRGRPTLRTPDEERELVEGDVACFVRGGAGAHQVRNTTEESVRILMLSTRLAPEIIEYPDSDKVLTKDAKDDDIFTARHGEPVEYWDGES